MTERSVVVTGTLAGQRLDRAVSQLLSVSRSVSRAAIEAGDVELNGEVVEAPAGRVTEGDTLIVRFVAEPAAGAREADDR